MASEPPIRPVLNGAKTVTNGRDARGRFLLGNSGGGRPANPFARYQAELRGALLAEVAPADVRAILRQVIRIAKRGHLPATELIFKWVLGAPPAPVDPIASMNTSSAWRGRPTLIDQLALADDQVEDDPEGEARGGGRRRPRPRLPRRCRPCCRGSCGSWPRPRRASRCRHHRTLRPAGRPSRPVGWSGTPRPPCLLIHSS